MSATKPVGAAAPRRTYLAHAVWPARTEPTHTEPTGAEEPDAEVAARDWVGELTAEGPERDPALRDLHALMVRAARHQVRRMRSMLPGFDSGECDDLAVAAAGDAMVACLQKVHTFEGRSRFTTWAYKFAILQTATEVRRQAWAFREVPLEDPGTWHSRGADPQLVVQGHDLAAEVGRALDVALTSHQRRIAVALLIDNVPIDVLADRLGTTRGSLYKTLHDARARLRRHLVATGHLDPPSTDPPSTDPLSPREEQR